MLRFRFLVCFLVLMLFSLAATTVLAIKCEEFVCDKSKQDENEYLRCVSDKRSCLEQELSSIKKEKITLSNTLGLINGRINLQQLKINQTIEEIATLERDIKVLDERIAGLNVSLDRLTTVLVQRIQSQYKRTSTKTAPVMIALNSSAQTALQEYKYVTLAGKHTADAMARAELQRATYDEQKNLKEQKQTEVEKKKDQLEAERNALASERKEQQFLLQETQNNEAKYQKELEVTLNELNAIQSIIAGKGNESNAGEVKQGDKIASVISGASTCSNGTHLHFEVAQNGTTLNPAGFLKPISAQWNNSPDGQFGFGGSWDWPLHDPAKINQGYGMTYYARVRRAYGGAPHTGIDMASKSQNLAVLAVKDGTLYRGSIACGRGQLRYVRVKHKDSDISTYYLHVNY